MAHFSGGRSQYRRRTERSIERVVEVPFESEGGHAFRMIIYRNLIDGAEHVALVKGRLGSGAPALVRVHSLDLATDLFRHAGPRSDFIPKALKAIGEHDGPGVMLFLRDSATSWAQRYKDGLHNAKPSLSLREYGVGAQILRDVGVEDMILLSASAVRMSALDGYGLRIVDYRKIGEEPVVAVPRVA